MVSRKKLPFIREGVSFGRSEWVLEIDFTKTLTGDSSAKTCHETKAYVTRPPATAARRK